MTLAAPAPRTLSPAQEPPLATVTLRGPLTVAHAEAWRSRLAERLATDGALHIDLADLTEIDAFGVQLLYSAASTAELTGRPFRLSNAPKLYSDACDAIGLGRPVFSRAQQP